MTGVTDRLTVDDCLRAGYCPSGIRRWMHAHNYDLKKFLIEGMPLDEARGFKDAHIVRALRLKERGDGR